MLRGNILAKVDGKGRLKLPSAHRSVIEPQYGKDFFVTSLRGESVLIYPMEVYAKLEEQLIPRYYDDRFIWVKMMQSAIGMNAYYFNSHRMMRRYVTEAYIR